MENPPWGMTIQESTLENDRTRIHTGESTLESDHLRIHTGEWSFKCKVGWCKSKVLFMTSLKDVWMFLYENQVVERPAPNYCFFQNV